MELDLSRLNALGLAAGETVATAADQSATAAGDHRQAARSTAAQEPGPRQGSSQDTGSGRESGQRRPEEPQPGGHALLQMKIDRAKEERARTLEVYREYQENKKTTSQLEAEILKGLKTGESVYSLFLKAAKAISLVTHNATFYSQVEADTAAIYGAGLLEPYPLQKELAEIEGRLSRLREALERAGEPEDSRERIKAAIRAHEARAEQIKGQLQQGEQIPYGYEPLPY